MGPAPSQDLSTASVALRDRPPASLVRRAAARAIDLATVFFLMWALVVTRVLFFMDRLSDRIHPDPWGRAFVATVTFVVLATVYEIVFLVANKGQTPGKDIMKLRVIRRAEGDDVGPVPRRRPVVGARRRPPRAASGARRRAGRRHCPARAGPSPPQPRGSPGGDGGGALRPRPGGPGQQGRVAPSPSAPDVGDGDAERSGDQEH